MKSLPRNLLIALIVLLPAQLAGQGFTIESVVDTQFQGGLGSVVGIAAKMSGRSLRNVATTTYLQGHQLGTDNATIGAIYDLDAERMINIDHKQKTYSSTTFAEWAAAMERARASAEQSQAKEDAKAAKADPTKAGDKDKVDVKYHVKVDRRPSSEYRMVKGYDKAERLFITIELEAEATPEGQKGEQIGSMVVLLDQWITTDSALVRAYSDFYKLYAQKLGREFRSQVQGLQTLFASDARMKDGFEAASREMQKSEGIPLSSTMYVVLVPPGLTFDRDLAMREASAAEAKNPSASTTVVDNAVTTTKEAAITEIEKPKSKFGGFLQAVKSAAVDAGKRMERANQNNDAPPKQTTLLVIVDQVKSIVTGAVPAAKFTAPAGYREVKPKTM